MKCPNCGSADYTIIQTCLLRKYYRNEKLISRNMENIETLKKSDSGGLFRCDECNSDLFVRDVKRNPMKEEEVVK